MVHGLAVGMLLMAAGYYGTQFLFYNSGNPETKLAFSTYSRCLSLKSSTDKEIKILYNNCMNSLENQMKKYIDSGKINLNDCELAKDEAKVAYCTVWVWYVPRQIILTNKQYIDILLARRSIIKPEITISKKLSDSLLLNPSVGRESVVVQVKKSDIKPTLHTVSQVVKPVTDQVVVQVKKPDVHPMLQTLSQMVKPLTDQLVVQVKKTDVNPTLHAISQFVKPLTDQLVVQVKKPESKPILTISQVKQPVQEIKATVTNPAPNMFSMYGQLKQDNNPVKTTVIQANKPTGQFPMFGQFQGPNAQFKKENAGFNYNTMQQPGGYMPFTPHNFGYQNRGNHYGYPWGTYH